MFGVHLSISVTIRGANPLPKRFRSTMQSYYTLLDHTADLRIRVTGDDPADLYRNAGLALFDLINRSDRLESREVIEIDVTGDDPADLMVNYLRELLYLWTGNEKLVKMIDILQISDTAVSARVSTDRYQPQRHTILHEIKAVTYHQIEVSRTTDGWQARVVFDV
jgi:SHS2 domain-containing protein